MGDNNLKFEIISSNKKNYLFWNQVLQVAKIYVWLSDNYITNIQLLRNLSDAMKTKVRPWSKEPDQANNETDGKLVQCLHRNGK